MPDICQQLIACHPEPSTVVREASRRAHSKDAGTFDDRSGIKEFWVHRRDRD
jgi:hypothetical protein